VRGVVSGLRSADLAAELTGARSVLRSAGIDTRVIGEDARLPDDVQRALAWVVREAVTNVVRHAHARRCTIDLDVTAPTGVGLGRATLTITNDGVGAVARGAPGSGLLGLTERLGEVGGELTTAADADRFTLRATVPLTATTPAERR
jgi:two-component system, NarL family, sensor histidine kinase DesK